MSLNDVKRLLKKYKYLLLIVLAVVFVIFAFIFKLVNKDAFIIAFDYMNKNIKKFMKYNQKIDDEAFEKIEKAEKKKEELIKKINERFESETVEVKKEHKARVKKELEELEGNEEALEQWYNDFLNNNLI